MFVPLFNSGAHLSKEIGHVYKVALGYQGVYFGKIDEKTDNDRNECCD